jgi:hypothetical protein
MSRGRLINLVIWLWLGLSNFFRPLNETGDYWDYLGHHLLSVNESLVHAADDPGRAMGALIVPFLLWLLFDRIIRRRQRRKRQATS